jgi:transcriptional regulator with XRE-family HTH domain
VFYENFLRLCNSISKAPSAVALECGLKKSTVTKWKQGGKPTDATAQKIAGYFGVPTEDLLGEGPKEKASAQNEGSGAERFAQQLFAAHKDIAPEDYDQDDMDDIATFMRMIKKRKNDDE